MNTRLPLPYPMAVNDKPYEKHVAEQSLDREKRFDTKAETTAEYVRRWCSANGLRHAGLEPLCKCGQPRQYYGLIGGYSVRCKECNERSAARQRAARAAKKKP